MLKGNMKSNIILLLLFFYACLSFPILKWNDQLFFNVLNPILWLSLLLFGIVFFKKDYCRKKYKYDFFQIVIISVIIYLIIYYMLGLITGYVTLPYTRSFLGIIKNIIKFVFPIAIMEYVRGYLINRSGKKKSLLIIITGIFAILNIVMQVYNFVILDVNDAFDLIFSIIVPEIAKSMLLSYLTYHSDFVPSMLYAILPAMLLYIIPVIPDLSWFLDGSIQLLLTFIVYFTSYNFYIKKSKIIKKNKKVGVYLLPILVLIIPILILVSGIFKFQIMAILTNSMVPVYSRGDAVIVEHLNEQEKQELKKGDIIVFNYNNRKVLHRIIDIKENVSGLRTYKTKGDNLETEDAWEISDKDIEAKYLCTIYKIGYPSVWISELK